MRVLDRNMLEDFLTKKSTPLEDLQGIAVSLQIGRQLDATGVITGSLYEENGFIALRIHPAGFGPARENADIFNDSDESVRLTETEPLKDMLFQRGRTMRAIQTRYQMSPASSNSMHSTSVL